MAKLTVYFKFKEIDSYLFEDKVVHIGRDESNDIRIDSLAVAPAHAAIIIRDDAATIKQLNDNFPLIVNGQVTKECPLNDEDTITVGKHDLVYYSEERQDRADAQESEQLILEDGHLSSEQDDRHAPSASLQVLDGPNIGKVVWLKKAMTRLGNDHSGIIVISKRKDGYFVSALKNNDSISVNKQPIKESYLQLKQNDVLSINNVSLQFFMQ